MSVLTLHLPCCLSCRAVVCSNTFVSIDISVYCDVLLLRECGVNVDTFNMHIPQFTHKQLRTGLCECIAVTRWVDSRNYRSNLNSMFSLASFQAHFIKKKNPYLLFSECGYPYSLFSVREITRKTNTLLFYRIRAKCGESILKVVGFCILKGYFLFRKLLDLTIKVKSFDDCKKKVLSPLLHRLHLLFKVATSNGSAHRESGSFMSTRVVCD